MRFNFKLWSQNNSNPIEDILEMIKTVENQTGYRETGPLEKEYNDRIMALWDRCLPYIFEKLKEERRVDKVINSLYSRMKYR